MDREIGWIEEFETLISPSFIDRGVNRDALKSWIEKNFIHRHTLEKAIIEEINTARSEGQATSRLTSLYMKFNGKEIENDYISKSELTEWLKEQKKKQWDKSPRFVDGEDKWGERYAEIDSDKTNGFNQALSLVSEYLNRS